MAKLDKFQLEVLCVCGHERKWHGSKKHGGDAWEPHLEDCAASVGNGFQFCSCKNFREAKSQEEIEMAKEKKPGSSARKPKGEGRTPRLAGMVDSPLTIFMTTGGKEYKGVVLTSGIIKIDEKEFTSPSSAGSYILGKDEKGKPRQVDGWKSWYFNRDGERVMLNTLRGSKSPLALEAPKPRKAKAAAPKKAKSATPRATRKPRAARSKANGSTTAKQDVSDSDVPQNEATA